ncbi:MAG: rod shape-determining protein MreD [Chloroflexota bacterium]
MALIVYAFVLLLAALAEATTGYRLDVVGGGRLNLVLVLVAVWSLVRGAQDGLLVGLAGGLALDLMSGSPFGLNTMLLGMIGAGTALAGGTLTRGGLALLFGTAVLTTVVYHGSMVLILRAFGWEFPGLMRFVNVLVPTIFLNALAMPFAASLARRLDRTMSSWQRMELE